MTETLIAGGIVLVLLALARGGAPPEWNLLLRWGFAVTAAGLATGIPFGVAYHWALYRALAPLGRLERDWIWRPTGYHRLLPPTRRRAVLGLFYAGAASLLVTLAGCLLVLAGIVTG